MRSPSELAEAIRSFSFGSISGSVSRDGQTTAEAAPYLSSEVRYCGFERVINSGGALEISVVWSSRQMRRAMSAPVRN